METKKFLVVASVNNHVAVLGKILAAFIKRHIDIDHLSVSKSPVEGVNSVTICARTTEQAMRRLTAQLGSVYDVVDVSYHHYNELGAEAS